MTMQQLLSALLNHLILLVPLPVLVAVPFAYIHRLVGAILVVLPQSWIEGADVLVAIPSCLQWTRFSFYEHVSNPIRGRVHLDKRDDLPRRERVRVFPPCQNGHDDSWRILREQREQLGVDERGNIKSHKGTF